MPPFPASVSARPARGLVPALGRNETNGVIETFDCWAVAVWADTRMAELAAAAEKNLVRCTGYSKRWSLRRSARDRPEGSTALTHCYRTTSVFQCLPQRPRCPESRTR